MSEDTSRPWSVFHSVREDRLKKTRKVRGGEGEGRIGAGNRMSMPKQIQGIWLRKERLGNVRSTRQGVDVESHSSDALFHNHPAHLLGLGHSRIRLVG
jgi:hypothetical protein